MKEEDYIKRTMKRLNQEMSPLRDESTKDAAYVREMWSQYTRNADYNVATAKPQIKREPEQVHAYLKQMEEGASSQDAETLKQVADGSISKDDVKMQNYLIRQFQRKRY